MAGYLLIAFLLGLYFWRRSAQSTEDYFVSGPQVSWWVRAGQAARRNPERVAQSGRVAAGEWLC